MDGNLAITIRGMTAADRSEYVGTALGPLRHVIDEQSVIVRGVVNIFVASYRRQTGVLLRPTQFLYIIYP